MPNIVRHCPVARYWRKVKNVRKSSKCRFRLSLCKTACANVVLLEICVETLCASVVLLKIGAMCKQAKNCAKRIAQLKIFFVMCKQGKNCANRIAQLKMYLNWLIWSVCATTNLKKKSVFC